MRVLPLSLNLNYTKGCKRKNNTNNHISFKAQIPDEYKTREKYRQLLYPSDSLFSATRLADAGFQRNIAPMLKMLGEDTSVSDEFKSFILIRKDSNPLFDRISGLSKLNMIECANNYEIIKAMLDASPNVETTKKLLLTPSGDNERIPLSAAKNEEVVRLLLEASPDQQTVLAQLNHKEINGKETVFENANEALKDVMLEYCSEETKNDMLSKPDFYSNAYSVSFAKYLSKISDDNILKDTLFTPLRREIKPDTMAVRPIISYLQPSEVMNILTKIKDNSIKSELLLAHWNDVELSRGYAISKTRVTNSTSNILSKLRKPEDKARLADMLFNVIKDNSTTNETALELVQNYKDAVPEVTKQSFKEIENYLQML